MVKSSNLDIVKISKETGGYIANSSPIFENIPINSCSKEILKEAVTGTPLIRLGEGNFNKSNFGFNKVNFDSNKSTKNSNGHRVMIIAGVHGNELPPQIAAIHLIDRLKNVELNGEVYIVPFLAPKATMDNSRWFDGADLNRITSHYGSVTNNILNIAKELNVDSIGDFHSTGPNSVPGKEAIFCTMKPSPESHYIANYIAKNINSEIIFYPVAGQGYQGTIEDECNLRGTPSVTCEVFCKNGHADKKTYMRSLEQMLSYLAYFGIISDNFDKFL
ncbi:MAG: succinylglutamate desuccinylase/aspartoacylase family protein [Methanobrevibacter sp.]|nr:succinylglutamate desuccinylase/aspartoacylase family protein [Methanobrevibacter sp.]